MTAAERGETRTPRRGRRWSIAALAALVATALVAVGLISRRETSDVTVLPASIALPAGFRDELVAQIPLPTAIAFAPDGHMLVATQPGLLFAVTPAGRSRVALDLSDRICTERERGMSGVAVSPNFATDRGVYVYYTYDKHGGCEIQSARSPVNRLVRLELSPTTFEADIESERVIIDNIPSFGGTHNAGDIKFGPDGMLYVSVGDGGRDYRERSDTSEENEAAGDLNALLGKILRITPDGGVPPDNPLLGPRSVPCATIGVAEVGMVCREIFAWGLRNPFRMSFEPGSSDGRLFVNDTGQNAWEEVNVGRPGADYGWNLREGACERGSTNDCPPPPDGVVDPIVAYRHSECGAITGGAFVPTDVWPPEYDGAYLFADWLCGRIFWLQADDEEEVRARSDADDLDTFGDGFGAGSITTLLFGPATSGEALYYTTFSNGGEIHRIVAS